MGKRAWMVRAQRGGRLYNTFKERKVGAIGWNEIGPLAALTSREAIAQLVRKTWPDWKTQAAAMAEGQLQCSFRLA